MELLESTLVAVWLAVATAGCGGKSAANGRGGSIPVCPSAVVVDVADGPCLIGQACGAGQCEDPRGPFSIGCPGVSVPECASDGDCGPGRLCVPDKAPCASPMKCVSSCTVSPCASDEQCGSDGRCTPTSCMSGYPCRAGWLCAPERPQTPGQAYESSDDHDCSPASCIDDGFVCPPATPCNPSAGSDLHGCNLPRCDQGGSCPEDSRCQPADAAFGDGCVPLRCAQDDDCDCGACLMGQCAYQPGICVAQLH